MTGTQKGSEHKPTPDNSGEKTKAALERARTEAKAAKARAKAEEQARLKAEKGLTEAFEQEAAAQAEIEEEREARIRVERALTQVQEELKAARDEIERERRARAKAELARDEAEKALTEEMRSLWLDVGNVESPAIEVVERGVEKRVSFVVRLTVDERGQPKRTEIEHPLSGKKESFPSLDVQRMADFMKTCFSPPSVLMPGSPAELTPTKAEAVTPEPKKPAANLMVSSVQVFRSETPDVPASFLSQGEAFVVQVRFQLEGLEASSITSNEPPFEMHIYAHEVTRGGSSLLKTYRANLMKDVLEYSAQIQIPRLPTGLHRLFTQVALYEPVKMINHLEGPVIKVLGERSSAEAVIAMEVR